jgi:uncharacterized tellurite resistance protein B-like protein
MPVFDAIKSFVADLANAEPRSGGLGDREFRVGYAALLVHAATIDGDMSGNERSQLALLLKQRFELSDIAVDELISQAIAADEKAVDFYHFTHAISGALDETERLRMIEMIWTVAFADGKISDYEDNLIWRVADLLGVSSPERIALRQRVAAATGNA